MKVVRKVIVATGVTALAALAVAATASAHARVSPAVVVKADLGPASSRRRARGRTWCWAGCVADLDQEETVAATLRAVRADADRRRTLSLRRPVQRRQLGP